MNRTRLPFGIIGIVIATFVVIILATTGTGAKTARPLVAPASNIAVEQTSLGKTLVDANGRVLYLFEADKRDQSTLSAAGQAVWPPLTSPTKPAAGSGVTASQITLIRGAAGTSQVAYNGHPLYYYVGDQGRGQTKGQGLNQFGALWYVLSPAGTAITSAPTTPAPAPSSTSSSGYGY
jgi:predicted lipoprotein with Yx(FWY)xxD motif